MHTGHAQTVVTRAPSTSPPAQLAFKRMGLPPHLVPETRDAGVGPQILGHLKRLQQLAKQVRARVCVHTHTRSC